MSNKDQGLARFFISKMAHEQAGSGVRFIVQTLIDQGMQALPDAEDDFTIPLPTAAKGAFVLKAEQVAPDDWCLYIRFGQMSGNNIIVSQAEENGVYAPISLEMKKDGAPRPRPN